MLLLYNFRDNKTEVLADIARKCDGSNSNLGNLSPSPTHSNINSRKLMACMVSFLLTVVISVLGHISKYSRQMPVFIINALFVSPIFNLKNVAIYPVFTSFISHTKDVLLRNIHYLDEEEWLP